MRVARALDRLEPWGFGVATIEEGRALRAAGIDRPIIVFTPVTGSELDDIRAARLTPILARAEDIAAWRGTGGGEWQLSIDTGMGRDGVRWSEMSNVLAETALSAPQGAYTHFHSSEADAASVTEQERRFETALGSLRVRPRMLHTENSAALARRDRSAWSHARPGIFLYGVGSGLAVRVAPEPVVSVRARIVALRTRVRGRYRELRRHLARGRRAHDRDRRDRIRRWLPPRVQRTRAQRCWAAAACRWRAWSRWT